MPADVLSPIQGQEAIMADTPLIACRGALAHLATKDADARRRGAGDDDGWLDPYAVPYALDFDKLLCSKSIRRLGQKSQVVALPPNSHTRNRLSHSFEVVSAAAAIARVLGLNEDLCRAGGLGHDIGHTPFGHAGEEFLAKVTGKPFRHEVFGAIVAQRIERKGRGLNLTVQTLRVIRNHSRGAGDLHTAGMSPEESAVMFSDKIAYVFADYNDLFARNALTGSELSLADHPGLEDAIDWFGANQRERTRTCIEALCIESAEAGAVRFATSETARRFAELKTRMYAVYKAVRKDYILPVMEQVYATLAGIEPEVDPVVAFALMNDRDIAWLHQRGFERGYIAAADLARLSIADVLPHLRGKTFDITDPDIDW